MPLNHAPSASAAARPSTSKPAPAALKRPGRTTKTQLRAPQVQSNDANHQQYGIDGEHHPALPTRRETPSPAVALGGKPVLVGIVRHRSRGNASKRCSLMYSRAESAEQTPTASRSFTAGGSRLQQRRVRRAHRSGGQWRTGHQPHLSSFCIGEWSVGCIRKGFRYAQGATNQARRNGGRMTSRRQRQHPVGATETIARS